MDVLRRFASFEIGEEELQRRLAGVFEIRFEALHAGVDGRTQRRTASGNFRMPEPGIVISRDHIAHALEQKRLGRITERDLVHWADPVAEHAYVLDPGDEDLIAEWLNDISVNLDAG
jgi:hypothetical protein